MTYALNISRTGSAFGQDRGDMGGRGERELRAGAICRADGGTQV
jgi:hypothetical protein